MFAFGDARYFGSAGASHLGSAVVGMAVAPAGRGYLLATSKGDVLRFGAVPLGAAKLAAPLGSAVAAMAATPDAKGYWLVTTKGKVVPFGDAHNYGSMTGALKAAIVGIAPTANGKGYWLAARDGAVFAFGDASPPHQAVAGPQAPGPVSAIALSFNTGNPRAKTAHASPTTATAAAAAGTGTAAGTGAAVGIGAPAGDRWCSHTAATQQHPRPRPPPRPQRPRPHRRPGELHQPGFSTSDAEGTENIDRWRRVLVGEQRRLERVARATDHLGVQPVELVRRV